MTVLVTGATGFLGSRLAHQLAASGQRVRVLVRSTSDHRRLAGLDLDIATGDVTDRASVDAALEGVALVHHVAALYEFGTPDAEHMWQVNVNGTINVLESAAQRGIPAVHVSSVAALGPTGKEPADESHWSHTAPRSPYEASKRAAHECARGLAEGGAPVRIAMPSGIYGPDDPSLLGRTIQLLTRYPVPVGAAPDLLMSYVHVDDCADGLARLADKGNAGDEYILSAQALTFREVFETLAEVSGRQPPRAWIPTAVVQLAGRAAGPVAGFAGRWGHVMKDLLAMAGGGNFCFTGAKAERELGWQPRSFADGMTQTVAWLRAQEGGRGR